MQDIWGRWKVNSEVIKIVLSSELKVVLDPFCGNLSTSHAFLEANPEIIMHCSDYNKDLIDLYDAILNCTFRPHHHGTIPIQEFEDLRYAEPSPLRTFAGYRSDKKPVRYKGASGYQRGADSLMRRFKHCRRMIVKHAPYWDINPPVEAVIYCRLPEIWDKFDYDRFFQWASALENTCYIFTPTTPFKCVWELHKERLYINH